ncbi:MAG TPA: nucleotidyltransferase domain-containing protein [Ktedonobacterales bacterium]|nr:nucleotidyltransferase domain-containing protein [Ktedonobacterales bacterium]
MQHILEQAEQIAARIGQIDGVVAVALGGSWSRGAGRPGSDIDLGIYYHPNQPPSVAALRQLAQELDDTHPADAITDYSGWGPWINGGGWLKINGQAVDWLYRDLELVTRCIDDCRAGKISAYYQPGHPHAFHTHIYMGEVHYCRPLYDHSGALAALKALTDPYPPRLKQAIIQTQWEAHFALETCRKSAARGDVFHVSGSLFRCVAILMQVLFALNERYIINEKGAVSAIDTFSLCPANVSEHISAILAHPGQTPEELLHTINQLDSIVQVVDQLC